MSGLSLMGCSVASALPEIRGAPVAYYSQWVSRSVVHNRRLNTQSAGINWQEIWRGTPYSVRCSEPPRSRGVGRGPRGQDLSWEGGRAGTGLQPQSARLRCHDPWRAAALFQPLASRSASSWGSRQGGSQAVPRHSQAPLPSRVRLPSSEVSSAIRNTCRRGA